MPEVVDNKWTICLQTVEVRSEKKKNVRIFISTSLLFMNTFVQICDIQQLCGIFMVFFKDFC
jgi:hypothetical protein